MQIENHKEEVPFAHYEELFKKLNPADVSERLNSVKWDGKEFYVNLLGREFAISHPEYAIRALDEGKLPPLPVQTFLLRYLLESRDVLWLGQWKTFREMPWGEMYMKPYSGRVLSRAAFTFGFKLAAFRAACEKMGVTMVQKTQIPESNACYDAAKELIEVEECDIIFADSFGHESFLMKAAQEYPA